MREIIFRGIEIGSGRWVRGDLRQVENKTYILDYDIGDDGISQISRVFNIYYEVEPESVGQYTGLKDKNGKEIYESDIVQGSTDIFENMTGRVTYAGCGFVIDGVAKYSKIREELNNSYEVIGNPWEHPHLLEGRDAE